jgi:hypothetical protein
MNPVCRRTAYIGTRNDYLRTLLLEQGLSKFLSPLTLKPHTTSVDTILANLFIDRDTASIKCGLTLLKDAPEPRSRFKHKRPVDAQLKTHFPSNNPETVPPSLVNELTERGFPFPDRISELAQVLWRSFCRNDFLLLSVEVRFSPEGSMQFVRSSATLDDSAVHRQPELFANSVQVTDEDEIDAEKSLLVYRKYISHVYLPRYSGNVGTVGMPIELYNLVNGAGLAMATNDTIALLNKGANANFLDAGGKASPESIKEAFRLVLKNPKVSPFIRLTKVNVILVNIFGGKS